MSALKGLRVVELAESVAGEYCGKLLADFGADVVKVERPGCGSHTRAMTPPSVFAYLNTNKRSVELDADDQAVQVLIASAHAVIDDHASAAELAKRHPDVVVCSITPFGHDTPDELRNAKAINVFHASGWGYHTPSHADPMKPPLKGPGRFLADYEAGLDAALCVASCLFAQMHRGQGEFIDISAHAVLVSRTDCILGRFITGEITPEGTRDDYDQQGPASFFACRDGYVYLYMTNGYHWVALKKLMGHPQWLDEFDDDWLEFSVTPEKVARFHRGFAPWIADHDRHTVAEQAQRLGVPLVPVHTVDELPALPQYRHRNFFRDVTHPVLGAAAYAGVPYLLSASPAEISSCAPALGQHTAEVLAGPAPRQRLRVTTPQLKSPQRPRGGPLEGVRVVELTKVWAGPYAGKLLAFLGAEVIKVETSTRPEEMRAYGGTDIDHAPFFLSINPEILSVDIDITTPAGSARLRELISRSDIVINNLRPGAMERQGLSYDALRAIKADIISVSIKMWGNDGPLGYQTGYAPCFAALAGLASLVGYEDGPPLGASMRYGDSTVGAAAAFAAIAALLHRELTGHGQFVDVSAVEVLTSMIGDCVVEQALTGERLEPDGNRHRDLSPHGCYPCADGDWITIAAADDAERRALHDVLGDGDLHQLTRPHDAAELARRLRRAGVAATKSATALDVIADESLWERGAYRFVSDHLEGQRPVLGPSWRMWRNEARIERGAPNLGEHNDYVFADQIQETR
ncbi:CaiB/BaiF CoA-transferase family protein [Mycobacterium sp. 1274761.0]|uniref:CaiB/BaiF CoA transferase family protein n=1 Tax=Mycobacterium sp. 1274761.0 TaxID=1834077 RepID=UPI0007FDA486|nr:CoA transferase [Mycobacterium sp. 1274761.0]OBK76273.1 CoA-transferase [Mycobacterium sp. 1274761.0]